jgi:hypothetical protein
MRTDRPPDEKNQNQPPPGLSEEQLDKWVNEKLGATVNNMLTARLNKFSENFEKKIGTSIGDTLKAQLPDLLKDFKPPTTEEPEGKGGKKNKEVDPELATLRQQMATLHQKTVDAETRANALREKSRTQAIREQVRSLLGKAGIDGDRFDAAYATLVHNGRIVAAEDPESDDAFFRDSAGVDAVALEVGLGSWLKTDQAKIFLPANGPRGSGSRPGTRPANGQPQTPEQIRANIAAELDRELQR